MVVLGNPPYSGESANKNNWIEKLMLEYKKEPNTSGKLQERNPKWLNDDYVKFIRMAQHFIEEKTKEGIIAFINPHGFLDNPTFRGMRWSLLKAFDKMYIIDLHGNSKKKETAPDGSKDENVFDIMQGVSINIFVKTGKKKPDQLAKVLHYDLFGKRQLKYDFLTQHSTKTIPFTLLAPEAPMYYFLPKNNIGVEIYTNGFNINELFVISGVGITTAHDEFVIQQNKNELLNFFQNFQQTIANEELLHKKFNVAKKTGWNILNGHSNIKNQKDLSIYIKPIAYRPFDTRYIFYEDKLVWRTVRKVMQNFLSENNDRKNIGLSITRRIEGDRNFADIFVFDKMIQHHSLSIKEVNNLMPLYLYPETNTLLGAEPRTPNLKPEIIATIAKGLGLNFTVEKENDATTFAPIDILDYIYAVLHSPSYRERYKEFLKSDFPRVPYPQDAQEFWALVALGEQLRGYPMEGNNTVEKIRYEDNKVYINNNQYFDNVSKIAWTFYIGGYQPAQKWLKDRKEQILSFEDIQHYQKIIVALIQTNKIMTQIDDILIL
jgi:predicted helicase